MPEMISEHFSFAEFTKTNTGLENIPTDREIAAGRLLAEKVLEPVRSHFKAKHPDKNIFVQVNSWFRSKDVNIAAGSKSLSSQHLYGEAVDFEIPGVPNSEIWQYINSGAVPFDQLIAERLSLRNGADGWIHVSYREGRLRREALSFTGKKYVSGLVYV